MEIELKYLLRDDLAKDRILNDKHLLEIKNPACDETVQMRAIYFDTEEGDLLFSLPAAWQEVSDRG